MNIGLALQMNLLGQGRGERRGRARLRQRAEARGAVARAQGEPELAAACEETAAGWASFDDESLSAGRVATIPDPRCTVRPGGARPLPAPGANSTVPANFTPRADETVPASQGSPATVECGWDSPDLSGRGARGESSGQ